MAISYFDNLRSFPWSLYECSLGLRNGNTIAIRGKEDSRIIAALVPWAAVDGPSTPQTLATDTAKLLQEAWRADVLPSGETHRITGIELRRNWPLSLADVANGDFVTLVYGRKPCGVFMPRGGILGLAEQSLSQVSKEAEERFNHAIGKLRTRERTSRADAIARLRQNEQRRDRTSRSILDAIHS